MSALPHPTAPAPLLTVAEVADYLRVSEMTVYRLITRGALVARRIGRSWRVRPADLEAFLEGSATVTATAAAS